MKVTVNAQFDASEIARDRGITNNELRKYLASRVKMRSDNYVPMQSGTMKNQTQIASDGSMLVYSQPYAHYQYHGMVMGPNVLTKNGWRSMASKGGKYYTGKALTYHGAPMRGPQWEKRMLADHKGDLEKDCAAYMKSKKGGV